MIELFKPGTRVRIGGDIEAIVLVANVAGVGPYDTNYTVAWWSGRDYRTATLMPFEIEEIPRETERVMIGFKNGF